MPDAPLVPCRAPGCPVLGPCVEHDAARARVERASRPFWDAWYHLARWRRPVSGLRARALARNPLCVECKSAGRVVAATQVDHVVPHRGDPTLFWALDNLQGLCDLHHAQKTKRGE